MSSCKSSAASINKDNAKKSSSFMSMMCGPKKEVNNNCEQNKCPPMPCFNTGDCKPAWLCSPPKPKAKKYEVPCGAKIVPISKTGRSGSRSGGSRACSSCGRSDEKKDKGPQVNNKNCPMMKPKCPPKGPQPAEKNESGFFSKITSFFGGKK